MDSFRESTCNYRHINGKPILYMIHYIVFSLPNVEIGRLLRRRNYINDVLRNVYRLWQRVLGVYNLNYNQHMAFAHFWQVYTADASVYTILYRVIFKIRDQWQNGVEEVTAADFEASYKYVRQCMEVRNSNIPKMVLERIYGRITREHTHYCQPRIEYGPKNPRQMRDDSHVYTFSEGSYKLYEIQPG